MKKQDFDPQRAYHYMPEQKRPAVRISPALFMALQLDLMKRGNFEVVAAA